jgi:lysophospholipase L1-like esterase
MRQDIFARTTAIVGGLLLVGTVASYIDLSQRANHQRADIERLIGALQTRDVGHLHNDVRLFAIKSQIAQATRPIVIAGDSITEAALLPSKICGHDVINAGVGGTDTGTYLAIAKRFLPAEPLPIIVVALGTNNSSIVAPQDNSFELSYRALLDYLSSRAATIVLAGIPPIDALNTIAAKTLSENTARGNDATIRTIAARRGNKFIDLRALITTDHLTADGIHVTAAGYQIWTGAVLDAVSAVACKAARVPL